MFFYQSPNSTLRNEQRRQQQQSAAASSSTPTAVVDASTSRFNGVDQSNTAPRQKRALPRSSHGARCTGSDQHRVSGAPQPQPSPVECALNDDHGDRREALPSTGEPQSNSRASSECAADSGYDSDLVEADFLQQHSHPPLPLPDATDEVRHISPACSYLLPEEEVLPCLARDATSSPVILMPPLPEVALPELLPAPAST